MLSGCATPLGQQYGTVGAAEGGIIGDQQTYRQGGYPQPAPRPCYWQRVAVYRDGYFVGYRDVCR